MAQGIMMKNVRTGKLKQGFVGFSWTVFFWGWLAMFFRGDWVNGCGLLGCEYFCWRLPRDPAVSIFLVTLVQILGGFFYNRVYTRSLVDKGFRLFDTGPKNRMGAAALGLPLEACAMPESGQADACEQGERPGPEPVAAGQDRTPALMVCSLAVAGLVLAGYMNRETIGNFFADLRTRGNQETLEHRDTAQARGQEEAGETADARLRLLADFDGRSSLSPDGELADMFKAGSRYTDLQRQRKLQELKGRIVRWTTKVHEVSSMGAHRFRIIPEPGGPLGMLVHVTVLGDADERYIESLKPGDRFTFTGMFAGRELFRQLVLDPAIINRPAAESGVRRSSSQSARRGRVLARTSVTARYLGPVRDVKERMGDFEDQQGVHYLLCVDEAMAARLKRSVGKTCQVIYVTETFYDGRKRAMVKGDRLESCEPSNGKAIAPGRPLTEAERKGRVLARASIEATYRGVDPDDPEFTTARFEDEQGVLFCLIVGDEKAAELEPYTGKRMRVTYATETFYYEGGEGMMKGDILKSAVPLN